MIGTMLALGLLAGGIAGGALAAKKLGSGGNTPVPGPTSGGSAVPRTASTLATGPGTPTPPDAIKAASANTAAANAAGLKARRRAAAGSAGSATIGTPSALQQTIRATDTPRMLLGS